MTVQSSSVTVQLGDRVKDRITGFVGIAECRAEWLYGCVRISVRPEKFGKDGKQPDLVTFDEPQLDVVKAGAVENRPYWRGPAVTRTDALPASGWRAAGGGRSDPEPR